MALASISSIGVYEDPLQTPDIPAEMIRFAPSLPFIASMMGRTQCVDDQTMFVAGYGSVYFPPYHYVRHIVRTAQEHYALFRIVDEHVPGLFDFKFEVPLDVSTAMLHDLASGVSPTIFNVPEGTDSITAETILRRRSHGVNPRYPVRVGRLKPGDSAFFASIGEATNAEYIGHEDASAYEALNLFSMHPELKQRMQDDPSFLVSITESVFNQIKATEVAITPKAGLHSVLYWRNLTGGKPIAPDHFNPRLHFVETKDDVGLKRRIKLLIMSLSDLSSITLPSYIQDATALYNERNLHGNMPKALVDGTDDADRFVRELFLPTFRLFVLGQGEVLKRRYEMMGKEVSLGVPNPEMRDAILARHNNLIASKAALHSLAEDVFAAADASQGTAPRGRYKVTPIFEQLLHRNLIKKVRDQKE